MSAALNAQADTSAQSSGTVPDISLGSFTSTFSTPARKLRIPSTSTATTAVSPPSSYFSKRRGEEATPVSKRLGHVEDGEEEEGDVLDTPDGRKGSERWGDTTADVSAPGRPKRTRSAGSKGGTNLTLRDQEKVRPYPRGPFVPVMIIHLYNISKRVIVPSLHCTQCSTSMRSRRRTSTSSSRYTSSRSASHSSPPTRSTPRSSRISTSRSRSSSAAWRSRS